MEEKYKQLRISMKAKKSKPDFSKEKEDQKRLYGERYRPSKHKIRGHQTRNLENEKKHLIKQADR